MRVLVFACINFRELDFYIGNLYIKIITYTYIYSLAPNGPPLNLSSVSNSSTSIYITWEAPDLYLRNGIIESYIIFYNASTGENKTITTNQTSYMFENLQKYTNYTFAVQAVNQIGKGRIVHITEQTMEDCKCF